MSQLLGRIAKLSSSSSSIGKEGLCLSELRFFSTTATTPYLLLMDSNRRGGASGETMVVDMNLYDPRKEERVKIPDQTLTEKLFYSRWIGSSRGWVGMKNRNDSSIRLTNIFNPSASVSSHQVISLPPLDGNRGHVSRFSLSASPNEEEDCVVAVKSTNSAVSLCRPGDLEWTRVEVPFFASDLMYSVRDRRFYLHRSREDNEYDGPIDLIDTSCSDFPQVSFHQRFRLSEFPKSRRVKPGFTSEYLVESPSGDSFIVYWCKEWLKNEGVTRGDNKTHRMETRAFVVLRQDPEQRIASYTQDIGDLCIFLGTSMCESFCVSATEYPGLKPNSVYFGSIGMGFGFYDLSSGTFHGEVNPPTSSSPCMWLAPLQ